MFVVVLLCGPMGEMGGCYGGLRKMDTRFGFGEVLSHSIFLVLFPCNVEPVCLWDSMCCGNLVIDLLFVIFVL